VIIKGWSRTSPESLNINDSLKISQFGLNGGQGLVTLHELQTISNQGIWAYAWRNLEPPTS